VREILDAAARIFLVSSEQMYAILRHYKHSLLANTKPIELFAFLHENDAVAIFSINIRKCALEQNR
jgi:hypothetical protein